VKREAGCESLPNAPQQNRYGFTVAVTLDDTGDWDFHHASPLSNKRNWPELAFAIAFGSGQS
jgi:hypothetical protein